MDTRNERRRIGPRGAECRPLMPSSWSMSAAFAHRPRREGRLPASGQPSETGPGSSVGCQPRRRRRPLGSARVPGGQEPTEVRPVGHAGPGKIRGPGGSACLQDKIQIQVVDDSTDATWRRCVFASSTSFFGFFLRMRAALTPVRVVVDEDRICSR